MNKTAYLLSVGVLLSWGLTIGAQPSGRGQKFALLVGVNKYQHPKLTELRFCENDVGELAQLLQDGDYQVTQLRGSDATKENIDRRLSDLLRTLQGPDSLVVAFAGHGLQFQQDAYFCPVDGRPFPEDTAGLIALSQVYRDMDRSFARVKVMLVDACRNDGTRGLRGVDGDNSPRPPRGVAAFFSCAAGEVAHEHEQFRHGVFFHYVLQGLRGQARNGRGQVTFASLVDYVSEEVATSVPVLIGEGARQSPNMKADLQGASPVLFAGAASPTRQFIDQDSLKQKLAKEDADRRNEADAKEAAAKKDAYEKEETAKKEDSPKPPVSTDDLKRASQVNGKEKQRIYAALLESGLEFGFQSIRSIENDDDLGRYIVEVVIQSVDRGESITTYYGVSKSEYSVRRLESLVP